MTVGIQGLTAQPLAKLWGLLAEDQTLEKDELKESSDSIPVIADSS